MAKLHSYYTLCPLIDQQNLLGVESDSGNGCAIVTLGRNIVIRYKLQDLKQLSSWTSKDRLTTQVIYDESSHRYAAVFNENKIRMWAEDESDLNDVKGYKFQSPLHTIVTSADISPILVRKDGATASLEWALQNRKSWSNGGILKPNERILDCQFIRSNGRANLCLLTKAQDTYACTIARLTEEHYLSDKEKVKKMELKRRMEQLCGHTFIGSGSGAYLLTLWSHGRLYAHPLTETSAESGTSTLIGVITNINTKHPVVMTCLNDTTIAVYGADISEEGAILMIYNVQFKLVQAAQKLKLYTKDAKLWKIEDKLLLAANRHLAIARFQLAPQKIATLLGSSLRFQTPNENGRNTKEQNVEEDVVVIQESTVARWDESNLRDEKLGTPTVQVPANLAKQISSYTNEGLSDAAIQEILIPQLIEAKDVSSIIWCLDTFKDLPEKLLVDLLVFSFRAPDTVFSSSENDITNDTANLGHRFTRNDFLDKIISVTYSDVSLVSYLRAGLNFDEILRLLNYLISKLDERESCSDYAVSETTSFNSPLSQPSDKQLYEWSILLLDSHYQHYVLSRDTEVSVLLNKLNSVLEDHIEILKDLEHLRPILNRTVNGKSLKVSSKDSNKYYTIEEIKLY